MSDVIFQRVVGPGYAGTSATSVTIGTGAQTFTTQTGLAYVPGERVGFYSAAAPTTNFMEGSVTSYSGTTLVVNIDVIGGSGAHTDWNIGCAGRTGQTGLTGPGYTATSTTSLAIGTGSTVFTTQAGLAYTVGARARASSNANTANYMEGLVTAYSGTSLTINVDTTGGSGTHADWNINIAGNVGAAGGGMLDPGSNGVVKRTALNTTAIAIGADLPLMVASGGSHSAGAVPDPGSTAGTTRFLREDATFAVPPGASSPSWTTFSSLLVNSWTDIGSGGGYPAGSYTKDAFGFVHFEGTIQNGTSTSGTTLFTLPAGFRPTAQVYRIVGCYNGSVNVPMLIGINSSGAVTIADGSAPHAIYMWLDFPTF